MSSKEDRRHHERAAVPPPGVADRRQRQPLQRMKPLLERPSQPLPSPNDWSFELIDEYHTVIKNTAERFGLDTYANQLEVITAEQMMDAYASVGMSRTVSLDGSLLPVSRTGRPAVSPGTTS